MANVWLIPGTDTKNIERINLLHPQVRKMALSMINNCFDTHSIYLRVTQGLRTVAEQDTLYALGRTAPGKKVTNAKGGKSWHNYGLAFDVVILDSRGKAVWDTNDSRWKKVCDAGIAAGLSQIQITNGKIKWLDVPHFEWHPGLTITQAHTIYKQHLNIKDVWGELTL